MSKSTKMTKKSSPVSRGLAAARRRGGPPPDARPAREQYETVEEWWDHLAAVAAACGPRLYLTERGECVVTKPLAGGGQITLCGALVEDGREWSSRPQVFEELDVANRAEIFDALRRALPLMTRACPDCRVALDPVAPDERWRSGGSFAVGDRLKDQALGEKVLARVVEIAAAGGARWAQIRGHELRLDADAKLEAGRAQLVGHELPEGGTLFSVRYGRFEEEQPA